MIDNVTNLIDWRVRREIEARRREGVVDRGAGVSIAPAVTRNESNRPFASAPVFNLMAYAASRRLRRP